MTRGESSPSSANSPSVSSAASYLLQTRQDDSGMELRHAPQLLEPAHAVRLGLQEIGQRRFVLAETKRAEPAKRQRAAVLRLEPNQTIEDAASVLPSLQLVERRPERPQPFLPLRLRGERLAVEIHRRLEVSGFARGVGLFLKGCERFARCGRAFGRSARLGRWRGGLGGLRVREPGRSERHRGHRAQHAEQLETPHVRVPVIRHSSFVIRSSSLVARRFTGPAAWHPAAAPALPR